MGLLGSYTTFSTLMLETWELRDAGLPWVGLLNIVASIIAGLVAVWLGLRLGRAI